MLENYNQPNVTLAGRLYEGGRGSVTVARFAGSNSCWDRNPGVACFALTPGYYLSRLCRDHLIPTNPCTL